MSWVKSSYRTNLYTLRRGLHKGRAVIFLTYDGSGFNVSIESAYLSTDIRTNIARRIASAIADGPLDDERIEAAAETVLALEGLI